MLEKTLEFNLKNNLLFFRIGSGLVPFVSHPVCQFNWQKHFKDDFKKIGNFLKKHNFRVSMYPDQFTLINSSNKEIVEKSFKELRYHCDVFDLMELSEEAKYKFMWAGFMETKRLL